MAVFERLDWQRFDVWALAQTRGLATIEQVSAARCEDWLAQNGYRLEALDFSRGIGDALLQFAELVDWRNQFGYALSRDSRNLDALRDGFEFDGGGHAGVGLVLRSFERAWQEDADWSRGLLEIASEYSLWELAQGRRFFAVIVVTDGASSLIHQPLGAPAVPGVFTGAFR